MFYLCFCSVLYSDWYMLEVKYIFWIYLMCVYVVKFIFKIKFVEKFSFKLLVLKILVLFLNCFSDVR